MKIEKKLAELIGYYSFNRNVGHTALLKEGSKHYDKGKFILASSKHNWDFLECEPNEVISLQNLETLRGHSKPMVIDNDALIEIFSEALMRIEALEKENKELRKKTQTILIRNNNE
jgi:hypothetical protein